MAIKPKTTIATLVKILITASFSIFSKARIKAMPKSRKLSKINRKAIIGSSGRTSIFVKIGAIKIIKMILKISKPILIKKIVERY